MAKMNTCKNPIMELNPYGYPVFIVHPSHHYELAVTVTHSLYDSCRSFVTKAHIYW